VGDFGHAKYGSPWMELRITLKVMPFPHVKLNGIQQVFGLSGGPFQPGKLSCWQSYPEVGAQVFIVTGSTAATQTSKAEFQDAPLQNVGVPKPSGGVIYYACR